MNNNKNKNFKLSYSDMMFNSHPQETSVSLFSLPSLSLFNIFSLKSLEMNKLNQKTKTKKNKDKLYLIRILYTLVNTVDGVKSKLVFEYHK
jgi:hypothetical protein